MFTNNYLLFISRSFKPHCRPNYNIHKYKIFIIVIFLSRLFKTNARTLMRADAHTTISGGRLGLDASVF